MTHQTKNYEDGTMATGTAPLPEHSPVEQAIREAGADRAPRVTPADIEAEIVAETYFTASEGGIGAYKTRNDVYQGFGQIHHESLGLLTFCVLVLRNGFTVTGESACASPENFNAEIGRRIARENAVNKVWPLLGFRLRDRLYDLQRSPEPAAPRPCTCGPNEGCAQSSGPCDRYEQSPL